MSYNFFASSNINFGKDAIATLPDILKELKVKKVMVVCDKMIMEVGIGTKVIEEAEKADVEITVYDGVIPNPTNQIVEEAAAIAKEAGIEAFIAVGGGSSMDTAKAVNVLMTNPGTIGEYGFSNANLGMVHAIAHTLSAHFGLAHGMANACVLPYVIRYNAESCPQQMVEMAEAIGLETTGNTDTDKYLLADELLRMIKLLGVKTISEQGITEDALDRLAEDALHEPVLNFNPRQGVTKEDILDILKKAF